MADVTSQSSDEALREEIVSSRETGQPVKTTLETDAQVIARVTDGIYRQPASAFRELISNAYDADATRVVVQTDRPRFRRISISDNGHGMGPEAVAHLIRHIGGSAKRSREGAALGITSETNPFYSPGGRRLIGKIGIGLFSVSQLTQSFQLVTKVSNENWRTVASVMLRQYGEGQTGNDEESFEAGLVTIWQEPALDLDAHGTTVVLNGLKPAARDALRSVGTWTRIRDSGQTPPRYHVGAVRADRDFEYQTGAGGRESLPWTNQDDPRKAFAHFVEAVSSPNDETRRNPKLDDLLDYYLQMVWQLSLAAPLPYVDEHPFDDRLVAVRKYLLGGNGPRSVRYLESDDGLAQTNDWPKSLGVADDFTVLFDDLELRRPLRFRNLPVTSNAVKQPMLFAGHLLEGFEGVDPAKSGGALEFYAYLLWAPKVVPSDEIGSLIRIHGASGTGFDETFMKYQIAETTRLRQLTCEVFVVQGLEAALNIDRESFNFAHPHVVRLTHWLHTAIGRAIATEKALARQLHRQNRARSADEQVAKLQELVEEFWGLVLGDDADSPIPPVRWYDTPPAASAAGPAEADAVLLPRQQILGKLRSGSSSQRAERQLSALVQMLGAMDLIDELEPDELQLLLRYVAEIMLVGS